MKKDPLLRNGDFIIFHRNWISTRRRHLDSAIKDRFGGRGGTGPHTRGYGALISACEKASQWESALQLFEAIPKAQLRCALGAMRRDGAGLELGAQMGC